MSTKTNTEKSFEFKYTAADIKKQEKWFKDSEKVYNENIQKVYHSKKKPCHTELVYNEKEKAWQKEWINLQIQHKKNFLDVHKSAEVYRPKKKYFLIACIAIIAVFAILLTMASLYDKQITSRFSSWALPALTKDSSRYFKDGVVYMPSDKAYGSSVANYIGQVYTDSIFAKIIEIIGVAPTTLVTIFSMGIVFWNCYRLKNRTTRIAVQTISVVLSFFWFWFTGFFTYFPQFCIAVVGLENYAPWGPTVNTATAMVFLFLSILVGGILTFAIYAGLKFVKYDVMCELLRWAMIVSSAALAAIIVMEVLIKPVLCRERFRFIYALRQVKGIQYANGYMPIEEYIQKKFIINGVGDSEGFVKWYQLQVANNPFKGGNTPFMSEDITKSFPSGHQTMAACGFLSLLILPRTVRACNTRKWKICIWTLVPILLVIFGMGRLVAGAHYLSDVTFGTIIAGGCLFIFYLANTYSSRWLDKACGLQIYPLHKCGEKALIKKQLRAK